MPQYDVIQRHAASVVPVRGGGTDSPQRASQEQSLHGAVPVPLIEVRSQVVALEVGKDVFHDEGIAQRQLESRIAAAIVFGVVEGSCSGVEGIEDAFRCIVQGLDIRYATIMVHGEIRYVAGTAADLHEQSSPVLGAAVL